MSKTPNRINVAEEREFHDAWAAIAADSGYLDVRKINEACTAPEIRFIRKTLGDLSGKKLLDLGCGLGEVSVYFAMEGADVTAVDLSEGMVEHTKRLAADYGVKLRGLPMSAEDIHQLDGESFDIIYAGNFFHHVDIAPLLPNLTKRLKPDGVLVSWDPLAYNPLIKVYRWLARKVRTTGEHPLEMSDIRLFRQNFAKVETHWFWFLTTVIFIIMFLFQRQNPSHVRYWKRVLKDADHWQGIYEPLEAADRFLLKRLPFLRPLCWNVVIVATQPKTD